MARSAKSYPFQIPLGKRLRELRCARGMSLGKLEETSGVLKGSICSIEHGRTNPTVATCMKLARGLGIELVELFVEWIDFSLDDEKPENEAAAGH